MCAKERVVLIAWRSPLFTFSAFFRQIVLLPIPVYAPAPMFYLNSLFFPWDLCAVLEPLARFPLEWVSRLFVAACGRHLFVLGSLRPVLGHFYLRIFFDLFILFVRT